MSVHTVAWPVTQHSGFVGDVLLKRPYVVQTSGLFDVGLHIGMACDTAFRF